MKEDRRIKKVSGIIPGDLRRIASDHHSKNSKTVQRIRSGKVISSADLDAVIHEEHHRQFKKIDCLECANCCKTTPALILSDDMDRIAKHLDRSVSDFIQEYIEMDEDGDFIINRTPCPFLDPENKCYTTIDFLLVFSQLYSNQ